MTDKLRMTAYHEAGHAVVGHILGKPLTYVALIPEGKEAGETVFVEEDPKLDKMKLAEREIITLYAGYVAIQKKFPDHDHIPGASCDIPKAYYKYALKACNNDHDAAKALLSNKQEETKKIVSSLWTAIEALAEKLLERKTIYSEDAIKIITEKGD